MQGLLGQPEEGWPKVIQKVILDSAHAKPIKGRPGAKLPKVDFKAIAKELPTKIHREPSDEEVLSYLMYPQVYLDFENQRTHYDNTSVIPTPNFLFVLQARQA